MESAVSRGPVVNLDALEYDDIEDNGIYTSRRATISDLIGARKLGYNLSVLPPGKVQCPFHSHHAEEEMFFILEGEGELRFGDRRLPIRANDVIACPPGGADVAHQIINTGTQTMRYLAVSTIAEVESCEYPDSGKVSVVAGKRGERVLREMFRIETAVDYYDRESGGADA
ncbi:MAG: cupin domain-containing protein [Sphingomonadaceae bacterium]